MPEDATEYVGIDVDEVEKNIGKVAVHMKILTTSQMSSNTFKMRSGM